LREHDEVNDSSVLLDLSTNNDHLISSETVNILFCLGDRTLTNCVALRWTKNSFLDRFLMVSF